VQHKPSHVNHCCCVTPLACLRAFAPSYPLQVFAVTQEVTAWHKPICFFISIVW
jgi:hypothetical protein